MKTIQFILIVVLFIIVFSNYFWILRIESKVLTELKNINIASKPSDTNPSSTQHSDSKDPSTDISKLIGELSDKIVNLDAKIESNKKVIPTQVERSTATPNKVETIAEKPKNYTYYTFIHSQEKTDANDDRAFYRIWNEGEQYFYEINPSDRIIHLALIEKPDGNLKKTFDYTNVPGTRIKNISPGKFVIQDGKFNIIEVGVIEIVT